MRPLSEFLSQANPMRSPTLGRLESEVLRVLWGKGESSVREVMEHLERPLAYTTVMTTLDRLFKKGLLERHMSERSFRYVACIPRREQAQTVGVSMFHPQATRDLLVSHLLDTVCAYDESLLDELEQNIAERRRQLESRDALASRGEGGV